MKKLIIGVLAAALFAFHPVHSEESDVPKGYCHVVVCNKIERFSLDPFSHLKDKFGEACFETVIEAQYAVKGEVLNSESRWYQGKSINPTKKSVTRVKEVKSCNK
jgi:hypothetical protein